MAQALWPYPLENPLENEKSLCKGGIVADRTKANRRGQRVLPPEDHDPNDFSVIPRPEHDPSKFSVMPPEDHDPNDYSVLPPEHKRRRRSKERPTNNGTA